MRYNRAPSAAFAAFLKSVGLAESLAAQRTVAGVTLDVHLRENDHIHIYCGLTRVVDARFTRGRLEVDAHSSYKQACGTGLFRSWAAEERGFAEALDRYLAGVTVSPTQTQSEGAIQAAWAKIQEPWVPFDREAVLGYGSRAIQTALVTYQARVVPPTAASEHLAWDAARFRKSADAWLTWAGSITNASAYNHYFVGRDGERSIIMANYARLTFPPCGAFMFEERLREWRGTGVWRAVRYEPWRLAGRRFVPSRDVTMPRVSERVRRELFT